MRKIKKACICFLLIVTLPACSGSNRGLIPSTSPLPDGVHGTIATEGDNCQYRLLGILPLSMPPNTQAALAEAKTSSGTEVLTDVTIDETSAWYLLFSNRCVHVRGMGVQTTPVQQATLR